MTLPGRGGERTHVAEEAKIVAFSGSPTSPRWLDPDEVAQLMTALPDANVPHDVATNTMAAVVRAVPSLEPDLVRVAHQVAEDLRGPPKVLHAPGHSFSDVAKKVVSIINLASVAELESAMGAPVDPLRFRGNLHVSGWPAWHEFTLLGSEIIVGAKARLKVVKRIVRCTATEVDPQTAIRDLPIPRILMDTYDHADCGIYAEVIEGGAIAPGDIIEATST